MSSAKQRLTKFLSRPKPKKASERTKKRNVIYSEKHLYLFFLMLCLVHFLFVGLLLALLSWLDIPDLDNVLDYTPPQSSIIYDSDGRIVDRMYTENRTVIAVEDMPKFLPQAFIAAEDSSFFEHRGVDFFSILRALINNLRQGKRGQGGSTITQQVIKSLLLSPEKTYIRKIREAILAWRIDRVLTKKEILNIYLNQIYLGEGAYGVEAAAQIYFGKSAVGLNLGECALLAGLPKAPSRYSLFHHQQLAAQRQKYVLNRMVANGYISAADARQAYQQRVFLSRRKQLAGEKNGYYLDEVKKRAREILGQPLQRAGVKIYTYLDSRLQSQAQKVVTAGVASFWQRQKERGISPKISPQAALVAVESASGKVRALVGGTSFAQTPYNRAVQAKRPAGSTFKPFVYSAALKLGWKPSSVIEDGPLFIRGARGKTWSPKNYAGKYMGTVTLKTALTYSLNTAAVRLMRKTGFSESQKIARAAGISAKMPRDLSLALGAVDISPLELTAAYTIFAESGRFHPPRFIDRIVFPSGRVFYPQKRPSVQVLTNAVAAQMRQMMISVIRNGTGRAVRDVPGVAGGKTGTSDASRDAWFIGYNNRYTTGVWVGYDHNLSMGHESGGKTAAPLWREFMMNIR